MKCFILSITNTCQKECPYCVMAKWRNNPAYPDKWDLPSLKAWLDFKGIGQGDHVQITGGEPTMHPDIWNLLDFLVLERHCKVLMLTNGTGLTDHRFRYWDKLKCIIAKHDTPDGAWNAILKHAMPHDRLDLDLRNSVNEKFKDVHEPVMCNAESHFYDKWWLMTNSGEVFLNWCGTGSPAIDSIWNVNGNVCHLGVDCGKCSFLASIWNELK